jgi:hypothetical protein
LTLFFSALRKPIFTGQFKYFYEKYSLPDFHYHILYVPNDRNKGSGT